MPGLLKRRRIRMEEDKENLSSASDSSPQKRLTKNNDLVSPMRRSLRKTGKPDFYESPSVSTPKSQDSIQKSSLTPMSTPSSVVETVQDSSGPGADTADSEDDFSDEEVTFKKPISIKAIKTKTTEPKKSKPRQQKNNIREGKSTIKSRKLPSTSREDADKESLFEIVKGSRSALRAVIDDWIEDYNEDREEAMVNLIQFFVQCCGCKGTVSREMIEADDSVKSVRELTKTFDEESHEYPLIMTGPTYKRFKANFSQFIELLISQCQFSIIYDEMMMDVVLSWLIGLSDSQVRAFRHTSTLAGLKIVTALIDVALKVSVESDNTQRQLDNENQKPPAKRSREKLEMLQKKREELRQQVNDIHEMMNRIFSGIFVHRYRDTRPEVRAVCIMELGHWMKSYSLHFLKQNYIRYTGWTLHDKVGEVRLKALESLEGLYENEDFKLQLELFTERFKDRIVSMTLDKETDVAVEATKVVCLLHRYNVLDDDDCHQVEQLAFCNQRQVAHAAGKFLVIRLFHNKFKDSPRKGKKGTESYIHQQNIKSLVDFLLDTEIHNHAAYLVDSIWEHTPLVKDWSTMTDMLLDSNCHVDLNDKQESALIEIMAASCKQASTGKGPVGRVVKKVMSTKEKKTIFEDRHTLSIHFMENLPDLLAKFGTDVDKASELVTIPQNFELEVYAEKRLTKRLEDLLNHIEDIVIKHADSKLLNACGKTMHILVDNDLIIRQAVEVVRDRLIDKTVDRFRQSVEIEIPTDDEDKDDSTYYTLLSNLKRIAAFYRAHDLGQWELHKDFSAIIEQGAKGSVDREVLLYTLRSMHLSVIWELTKIDRNEPDKATIRTLKKQLATFVSQLDELVQYSNEVVQGEVVHILSDLLIFFSKQLRNSAPMLAPLVYEADKSMQVRLRDLVMSRVFSSLDEEEEPEDEEEDDSRAEDLNKRREILVSFLKLITFNVFDMKLAAPIFGFLLKAYAGFADIIKHTMSKTKEINHIAFTKTLLLSLRQSFELVKDEQGGEIDKTSEDFVALKDLAHRFALLLGIQISTNQARQCSITIHRDGIVYALSQESSNSQSADGNEVPPNLAFLEILNEFTYRLIQQDRKGKNGILAYLDEKAKDYLQKKGGLWSPLITYRNVLKGDEKPVVRHQEEIEPQREEEEHADQDGNEHREDLPTEENLRTSSKRKSSDDMEEESKRRRVHYEDEEGNNEADEEDEDEEVEEDISQSEIIEESPAVKSKAKASSKNTRSPKSGTPSPKNSRSSSTRKAATSPAKKPAKSSPRVKGKPARQAVGSAKKASPSVNSRTKGNQSPRGTPKVGKKGSQGKKSPGRTKKNQRTPLSANSSQSSTENELKDSSDDFASPQFTTSQRSWISSQPKRGAKKARVSYSSTVVTPKKRRRSGTSASDVDSSQESIDQFSSPERRKRGRTT